MDKTNVVKIATAKASGNAKHPEKKADRKALLTKVSKAAFGEARATMTAVDAIKKAGNQDDARESYVTAYMASRCFPSQDWSESVLLKAAALLALKGYKVDAEDKKARRTQAQEVVYGSARKAWERALKAAGLKTTDNRGGANNPGKGKDAQDPAERVKGAKSAESEGFDTAKELFDHVVMQQASLLATLNKYGPKLKGYSVKWAEIVAKAKADIEAVKPGE